MAKPFPLLIFCQYLYRIIKIIPNLYLTNSFDNPRAESRKSQLSTHPFQYNGTKHFSRYDEWRALNAGMTFEKKLDINRVKIGNDVWIGEHVMIKRGVKIGDGVIIAAGSIVTKEVEPYSIVAGVPAKLIRKRFDDSTIERLMKLKWWNYDLSGFSKDIPFDIPKDAIKFIEGKIESSEINPASPSFIQVENIRKHVSIKTSA